jgi:hypothetical protein
MAEALFTLGNVLVLPFWLLMIAAPGWAGTRRLMGSPWVAAPTAVMYAALLAALAAGAGGGFDLAAFGSAAGVARLLADPLAATVAWLHFLTFDLFVGRWAYLDSQARGLSPWLMAPILFLILMAGPLGFGVYLAARGRRATIRES